VLWNLILGLVFLGSNRYGVYITDECPQEGYSCPKICDVDHIHLPEKECRYAKSWKEEVQLYKSRQESRKEVRKENWKESNKEKGILINGKAEQESRPDTTTVSSSR
jgi:hypothetical protein